MENGEAEHEHLKPYWWSTAACCDCESLGLKPYVILFDEPASALDSGLVGEVLSVIKILAQFGKTMVIVTHEIGFTREVADHVVFMDQGRIVEQGAVQQVLEQPKEGRTQNFLSRIL